MSSCWESAYLLEELLIFFTFLRQIGACPNATSARIIISVGKCEVDLASVICEYQFDVIAVVIDSTIKAQLVKVHDEGIMHKLVHCHLIEPSVQYVNLVLVHAVFLPTHYALEDEDRVCYND